MSNSDTHLSPLSSLRTISLSDLFYCHAPLIRSLHVHTTVLELMNSYLGISSGGSATSEVISQRRKKKMAMSKVNCFVEPLCFCLILPPPPPLLPPLLLLLLHPSQEGLPAPVEACCQFLCNFARIGAENQRALFDHIGPLLANLDENPGGPGPHPLL